MSHLSPREGVIRRVSVTERQDFRDHLLRLGVNGRRTRFAGSVSDDYVAAHALRTIDRGAVVFGWFLDGRLRAAAELHPLGDHRSAEAAFSVEDAWQDAGVGTALVGRVMRAARNRGIRRLVITCLPENARMRHVATKCGARLDWHDGDVTGTLDAAVQSPFTLWREALDEGYGAVSAILEAGLPPSRLIPDRPIPDRLAPDRMAAAE